METKTIQLKFRAENRDIFKAIRDSAKKRNARGDGKVSQYQKRGHGDIGVRKREV